MTATVKTLRHDNDSTFEANTADSPGQEFQLVHYLRDLTRCGVGRASLGVAAMTLMNLAARADKKARCWPTLQQIADDMGCYKQRIAEDLATLVERGAITIAKRPVEPGCKGKWRNEYVILPVSNIVAKAAIPATAVPRPQSRTASANADMVRKAVPRPQFRSKRIRKTGIGRGAHNISTEGIHVSDQECSPTESRLRVGATRARTREATPPPAAAAAAAPEPKRQKPSLKQSNPDLSADVQLALSQWEALTDHERNAKHCGQARQCVEKHGLADTLGAMLEMWDMPDGFWQTGNLTFNAIKERVPDYRRGTLTYKKPASQASSAPRRDYRHNIADGYSKAGYEGMTEDLVGKANLSGENCPYCGWDTMKHNPFCKRPITLTPQQQAGRDRAIARLNADLIKHGKPPLSIDNTPLGGAS